jgi:nitrate reductase NapE component
VTGITDVGAKVPETASVNAEAVDVGQVQDPRQNAAMRARLRWILGGLALLCLALGAAGFAFVVWMAKLPPGTLKVH